jgi:hypothetical protein
MSEKNPLPDTGRNGMDAAAIKKQSVILTIFR